MSLLRVSIFFAAAIVVGLGCSSENSGTSSGTSPGKINASAGETYVRNRRCATCHTVDENKPMAGATSKLPGFDAQFELYPPNLTPDNETGIGTWTDMQLTEAIRNGIDNDGVYLCPQMKHFGDMKDDEVGSIIAYLRGLEPVKSDIPRSICPPLKTKQ